jgi:hypothetical protein
LRISANLPMTPATASLAIAAQHASIETLDIDQGRAGRRNAKLKPDVTGVVEQCSPIARAVAGFRSQEINMEQILINLVAGALGGIGAGKSSSTFDLGTAGNIVSGLVGGGVLGQIVALLLPSLVAAAQSGNLSVGGVLSQAVAGGAGGAILTALIGAIKNRAAA